MCEPTEPAGETYISRSFTRREVALMGEKLLRFAVCLVLAALLLVYLAPKAY
jgi:hypothetical protein